MSSRAHAHSYDRVTPPAVFDQAQAEAFGEKVAGILTSGAVAAMMSIGHRLALFDLLAGMKPATSAEIAKAAGLDERYVREWLAVMVTGGVVQYEPKRKTYVLPAEHAASLTRGAPMGNLAVYAQTIPLMGVVEERLLDCFRNGGGTTYGDYPCFHQFMEEDSGQNVVQRLFDVLLPMIEANGADGLTRRLEQGIDVLDAGCGRGRALNALAARFPRSRFVGYDLCADAIADAQAEARAKGLGNVTFAARDLTDFDDQARFDLITSFDAVHDQRNPADFLCRLQGALRPGGVYVMQDIGGSARLENNLDFPMAAFLYAVSCSHCMPISLGQGGDGLGTMWGWETAEKLLNEAGFAQVRRNQLPHDPMNVWFVSRKG